MTVNSSKQQNNLSLIKKKKKDMMATTETWLERKEKGKHVHSRLRDGKGQELKCTVRRNRSVARYTAVAGQDVAFQYVVWQTKVQTRRALVRPDFGQSPTAQVMPPALASSSSQHTVSGLKPLARNLNGSQMPSAASNVHFSGRRPQSSLHTMLGPCFDFCLHQTDCPNSTCMK